MQTATQSHPRHITETSDSNTKERIFQTAAHLFARKGYRGVSMREISQESGVTKPTIYYYFGSKEGIYRQLIDATIQEVFSTLEHIEDYDLSAKEKLVVMTQRLFKLTANHPDFAKFFLTIVTPFSDDEVLSKFTKEVEKRSHVLTSVIAEGVSSGEFGAGANPQLATQIIAGAWQHFIWQQLAGKKRILTDELARDVIEILFKGLNE